jgi:hemerythrin-like domain-containing protein
MKRHKALITLSSDHQQGLVVSNKLKYTYKPTSSEITPLSDEDKKKMLINFYHEHLQEHFKMEEKVLAPYFPENDMMHKMLDEHVKLNKKIFEIDAAPADKDTLDDFGKTLETHIRFEERELFPMMEKTLTEEQLDEIGLLIENLKK